MKKKQIEAMLNAVAALVDSQHRVGDAPYRIDCDIDEDRISVYVTDSSDDDNVELIGEIMMENGFPVKPEQN